MKRLLVILAAMAVLVLGSYVSAGSIEGRVLEEQVLGAPHVEFSEHDPHPFPEGLSSRQRFHLRWPIAHAKTKWIYSFWHNSKSGNGVDLLESYQAQVLNALHEAGAEVLESSDPASSDPSLSFRIEYQKSNVTGEVSVTYKLNPNSLHYFEVSQLERQ